jgi:hypothetical protein
LWLKVQGNKFYVLSVIVRKIQRWRPSTCGCVIEQFVDYDAVLVPGMNISEPAFLLMNEICDKHQHLASTEFKENHADLSNNVMQWIEQAKARNLKQVDDLLAKPNLRRKTRMELESCRRQVLDHNQKITEEWQELVEPPWAFDEHIHDQAIVENRLKNG